jgi:hypothetical protein
MLTSFNGGELSPLMAGRPDVAKYGNGCKRMVGFRPTVQGPARACPGFRFVAEVKASANRTWLLRFEFSVEDSFMLEFGDRYIRFYTNHGQVQTSGVAAYNGATAYSIGDLVAQAGVTYYCIAATTGNAPPNATYWYAQTGTIYEIPSPWTAAQLTNDDGTFALQHAAQTGDEIYIVHGSVAPYKLSRFAPTKWTLAPVNFVPPPFQTINDTATTIYASAATGAVNLVASAAVFAASQVGQYIYLGEKDVRDVKQWEAGKAVVLNDVRRSDGKNYQALNAATTGGVKPTHSVGAAYDGDAGVQWQFLDAGYGWAKITAFTDSTHAQATVVSRLPSGAVGVGNPTTRWAFEAWNATDGYPTAVTFFRERLVFSRDSTLWFSVSADFTNFATKIDGIVTADSGFERTLVSERVNSIRWMSPGDVLLVGTLGDEWAIVEATTSDPFGPNNVKAKRQSAYGSNRATPVRVGSDTLFVQRAGRKVRAMAFRFEEDGFESPDITVFAEHITKPGVIDMAFQQEPSPYVWTVRSDGVLAGCLFNREQDVIGWFRRPLAGGVVECVEALPSPDGSQDDIWIICRYTINGVTRRYIGYLEKDDDDTTDQADWAFSDMLATYAGAPATTISGLGYLEGEEVWVLTDGAWHPNRTVTGGAIELQEPASKVQVGLPAEAFLETMSVDGGSGNGTAQGKTKRAHVVTLRVNRTLGGKAGTSDTNLVEIDYRDPDTPMGSASPPYTGDLEIDWPEGYDTSQTFVFKKDRPMAMTIVSIMPQSVVSEGR